MFRYNNFERLSNETKISKIVYEKLISESCSIDKVRQKWQNRLAVVIDEKEFSNLFKAITKVTINTKLRDFQYRFLHNNIVTNFHLKIWKIRQDDMCTFCNSVREYTVHLFVECRYSKQIWNEIKDYIAQNIDTETLNLLEWSVKTICFNLVHPKPASVVNMLVLITKQFIYRNRCASQLPNSNALIAEIEQIYKIEYNIAKENGKLVKHYQKWSQLYKNLEMSEHENQIQQMYINQYISRM